MDCFFSHRPQQQCAADNLHDREARAAWRHGGLVRRRSPAPSATGFTLRATEEGGIEEEDDTQELTKGFYSEVGGAGVKHG